MKKILFIISGLIFVASLSGRDPVVRQKIADSYYNRFDYYKAISMYEEILKDDPGNQVITSRLAESYRKINDSEKAEKSYEALVLSGTISNDEMLHYAEMLARNGKYVESSEWYHKYAAAVPADLRGNIFPAAFRDLTELLKDSADYKVSKVKFNSEVSDFSPAYYNDKLVFSSARTRQTAIKTSYNWTNSSYLDLYVADPSSTEAEPFSGSINSVYHEGPLTFTRNLDTVIFTRSNFHDKKFGKDSEGVNRLKLFMAVRKDATGDWSEPVSLPFNNDEYSVGHPALSSDGNTLYFASDMPGGSGGTDIYAVHKITSGDGTQTWSAPENQGRDINSEGNEIFPFADGKGKLWYASNGLAGMGGLDIFVTGIKDGTWQKPENLGYPVNTRFDDFGFITSNSGSDGYFSSDRNASNGNDDIFSVHRKGRNIVIKITDASTGKALPATDLELISGSAPSFRLMSDEKGLAKMVLAQEEQLKLLAQKDNYEKGRAEVAADQVMMTDTLNIKLNRVPVEIKFAGKVLSASNFLPVTTGKAYLTTKDGSKVEASCDAQGGFSYELLPGEDYLVEIKVLAPDKKCMTGQRAISTQGMEKSFTFNEMFPVYCVGDIIRVENIYYDLGKADIRPEAARELDKVYDIMKEYPGMVIELRSHTDSRGSAASNMALSQKRALSASEYLYKKGINRNRIVFRGYGETLPVNKCVDGVNCPEEEFQMNRRTEFKVLALDK